MRIQLITITGADDEVHPNLLKIRSDEYNFLEWGILISRKHGKPRQGLRYPSVAWLEELGKIGKKAAGHFKYSIHICGEYSYDMILRGEESAFFSEIPRPFIENASRCQLNINIKRLREGYQGALIVPSILYDRNTILQANDNNAELIGQVAPSGFDILYDASGGRGTEIKTLEPPFPGIFTGYSGGLGPDNIREVLSQIEVMPDVIGYPYGCWVDMETKVRSADRIDLKKVLEVLEISKEFI